MKEDRSQRFKRIATYRTNAIIDKLRLLGNLSNKVNYSYTDEEMKKIFTTIDSQLRIIKTKFATGKEKNKFTL